MSPIHKVALGFLVAAMVLYLIAPWAGVAALVFAVALELWAYVLAIAGILEKRFSSKKQTDKPRGAKATCARCSGLVPRNARRRSEGRHSSRRPIHERTWRRSSAARYRV